MQTLASLADALAQGRTSARELVEEALRRVRDPGREGFRAFVAVDDEGALAAADYLDGLRRRGRQPSPFAGIPVSVKDLFDLAGEVTRAGSVLLSDAPPATRDALAIARLKSAGFIVIGRTNMTEFAYSGVGLNPHHDTPRSIYDRATGRIPGGSSSGAAISVADGMVPMAIGSDTGGSCRIPAAYNGIVGWKPSVGRVPTTGAYPLSKTLDSIGPLANSVACCAVGDAIMAGDWDGHIVERGPDSLRLGVLETAVLDDLDPEVASSFDAGLSALVKAGAHLKRVSFPELAELPTINVKGGIAASEAFAHHKQQMSRDGARYDPRVMRRIQAGGGIAAADLIELQRRRAVLVDRCERLMEGFDGLVLPTTPNLPPPIAALDRDEDYLRYNARALRNTFIGNFLSCCAISLPLGGPGAPPAGFSIMAPWGRDRPLFSTAQAAENPLRL